MSKLEQRRALGLRRYEEQQGKIAALKSKPQKIAEAKQAVETVINASPNALESNRASGAKFDKTAYQREYMKKLRAKKKDHGTEKDG